MYKRQGADLQKAVGSGDGAWSAASDGRGRGQLRGIDGATTALERIGRFAPTLYLYDNYPGGVGLSEPLWKRQTELLLRAKYLVDGCACNAGCPSCVGPILAADEQAGEAPKALARRVLTALQTAP